MLWAPVEGSAVDLEKCLLGRHRNYTEIASGCMQTFPGAEYGPEEVEFIKAMDAYMQMNRRRFPQFTEVLAVLLSLGWRRVAEPGPLPKFPIRRADE
jgi:hypothetical protein